MSSSYLLNLKINSLQSQLDALSVYTGYTYELISTGGGTVDGNSFFAPQGNNTAYAYSSVQRDEPWTITFSVPNVPGNDMFVGITQDITQTFSNPSSPSMAAVEYGLLIDTNNNQGLLKVIDGQFSITGYDIGTYYKMVYNGSVISVSVDNVQLYTYPVTLQGVNIVVGSFAGGQINNIVFDGVSTGGGSGSNQNLQQVLAIGNNAGNEDILNVKDIFVNNYVNIGNAVSNTSQLHLCFDSGNTTTGYNWQMVASDTVTPQIDYQLYNNNALVGSAMTVRQGFTTFNQNVIANMGGFFTANGAAAVFDSAVNLPAIIMNSNVNVSETKTIPYGSAISIFQWQPSQLNEFLNTFTLFTKQLQFTINTNSGPAPGSVSLQFYLSTTKDAQFDDTNSLNIAWPSPNVGSTPNVYSITAPNIFLSFNDSVNTVLVDGIYLNVQATGDFTPGSTYYLDINFVSDITATFNKSVSTSPTVVS
jgi:hypothetical protein